MNTENIITAEETPTPPTTVKAAKAAKATKKKAKTAKAKAPAKPKKASTAADRLAAMLLRPEGCTHREARTALKWKSCLPYLLKVADARRIKLRKERVADGQVRYY